MAVWKDVQHLSYLHGLLPKVNCHEMLARVTPCRECPGAFLMCVAPKTDARVVELRLEQNQPEQEPNAVKILRLYTICALFQVVFLVMRSLLVVTVAGFASRSADIHADGSSVASTGGLVRSNPEVGYTQFRWLEED
jgi:hypothetical protein